MNSAHSSNSELELNNVITPSRIRKVFTAPKSPTDEESASSEDSSYQSESEEYEPGTNMVEDRLDHVDTTLEEIKEQISSLNRYNRLALFAIKTAFQISIIIGVTLM